jgi:hypothetical protein
MDLQDSQSVVETKEVIDLREKVEVYEQLMHELHFASSVSMSHERVMQLLEIISHWSYAHRCGNGEYSEEEQQEIIDRSFERIKQLVVHNQ